MGQSSSSSQNHSRYKSSSHHHSQQQQQQQQDGNGSTMNGGIGGHLSGCTSGAAKGLLRRASSLTSTPSSRLRSLRSPFSRRKSKQTPLSATFTAPNAADLDTLNINAATEEQLMTLPGIDRKLAQTIVEYRCRIGGRFQKIDDLALVSGMGAARLDRIRSEICVRRKPQQPSAFPLQNSVTGSSSSRTPSIDSIGTAPDTYCIVPGAASLLCNGGGGLASRPKLNVNTATVFDLQQLPGLNQELAAKIYDYRMRKGNFKTVDHLIKVKGITSSRLANTRIHLCATSDDSVSFNSFTSTPLKSTSLVRDDSADSSAPPTPGRLGSSSHRKSSSVPMKMNHKLVNGFQNAPINDIYELLGAYSHRPTVADHFQYERNGQRAVRIGSWNLDRMTMSKADNPGVLEVVCRTILENKLSIVSDIVRFKLEF